MYQTPVPAAAVAPEVPQKPLSASTTRAPCSAALMAAHVPAGPPPRTSTSALYSTDPAVADNFSARPAMDHPPQIQIRGAHRSRIAQHRVRSRVWQFQIFAPIWAKLPSIHTATEDSCVDISAVFSGRRTQQLSAPQSSDFSRIFLFCLDRKSTRLNS